MAGVVTTPFEGEVQKEPVVESKRHLNGDEAIMARFGKTQMLRVPSRPPSPPLTGIY